MNQIWVARKQLADATNNSRCINCAAFKVFHDIQKSVVYVRLVGKLDLHLVEIAQRVIQDRLLALSLALSLSLLSSLLLLSGLLLCGRSEGHEHAGLQLLPAWTLRLPSWLDRTASEDIGRPAGCSQRHLWLGLRTWVCKQPVGTVDCAWSNRDRLV